MQVVMSAACLPWCNASLAVPPELTTRAQTVKHLIALEVERSQRRREQGRLKKRERTGEILARVEDWFQMETNSPSITNQSLLLPLPPSLPSFPVYIYRCSDPYSFSLMRDTMSTFSEDPLSDTIPLIYHKHKTEIAHRRSHFARRLSVPGRGGKNCVRWLRKSEQDRQVPI